MYLGVAGACAEQAANASTPLALSLSSLDPLTIVVPPGSSGAVSNPGDIDIEATPSGGDGSYSFAWAISEESDPDSSFAVDDIGTTDDPSGRYNDAIFSTSFSVPLPPAPPDEPPQSGEFLIRCTVTDGTGATASANRLLIVDVG